MRSLRRRSTEKKYQERRKMPGGGLRHGPYEPFVLHPGISMLRRGKERRLARVPEKEAARNDSVSDHHPLRVSEHKESR